MLKQTEPAHQSVDGSSRLLSFFAGDPTQTSREGTDRRFSNIARSPRTAPSPTVAPGPTRALVPMRAPLPILTGARMSFPCSRM